jgi:hypothetical protein
MVFIGGVRWCCGWGLGAWGLVDRPGSHVSSCTAFPTLDTPLTDLLWHVVKMVFGNVPTHGWLAKVMWPASHTMAWLSLCFMPRHFLVSYCLWLCFILDIIKICMDFGPYGAFLSSDVLEMVDQHNSWNSLVMATYLLYLEWNVGVLAVNICILWPPTWRIATYGGCHTPFRDRGNEASIHVPKMFHSHV